MSFIESDFVGTLPGASGAQIRMQLLNGTSIPVVNTFASFQADTSEKPSKRLFRAVLRIVGTNVALPEQVFHSDFTSGSGDIQNAPRGHWPLVHFVCDSLKDAGYLALEPMDRTIEAILLATRLRYALNAAGRCRLVEKPGNKVLLDINVGKLEASEYADVLLYAKVSRKLRFLEEFFDTRFVCPDHFATKEFAQLETLFRGVTEGEFSTRRSEMIFDYVPQVADLNKPPYSAPGPISCRYSDPTFELLGQQVESGPIIVQIDRAMANAQDLAEIRRGRPVPGGLRFIVLDLQVKYRFESYVSSPHGCRRLEEFREKLVREEPEELAQLLTEPLISDVSSERARQITNGWLQFYDFPDRYCPQEPVIEEGHWRVPIWITYPDRQGGWVQDVFIDVKTGELDSPVSPEEMRRIGKSVAARLSCAS
jgi:hypothetical protein